MKTDSKRVALLTQAGGSLLSIPVIPVKFPRTQKQLLLSREDVEKAQVTPKH